ncbi:MAG: M28 family peptidase [Candidatus Gracilibacteria bacterium]|nr:M28 family peptidase [Candidatus Gracilibacteria bacterium]
MVRINFESFRYFLYGLFFLAFASFYVLLVNPLLLPVTKSTEKIDVSQGKLYDSVFYLTEFGIQRTYYATDVLNEVADYIYKNFKDNGCDEVEFQKYIVKEKEYKNVICRYKGEGDKIVVGAHYDVYGEYVQTVSGKMLFGVYKGADDNASGVAGLLELSRLVGIGKLNKNIEFVAYTLEEPPFFDSEEMGSYIHAKSLFDKNEKINFMMSLEMIGLFGDNLEQSYQMKFQNRFYPKNGTFIALVGTLFDFNIRELKKNMVSYSSIDIESMSAPRFIKGIDYSDHKNYWDFGYNAYLVTDTGFLRNKNYHNENDTIEKLNFEKMAEVVKGLYGILKEAK